MYMSMSDDFFRVPESMELSKNPALTSLCERLRRHVDYTNSICDRFCILLKLLPICTLHIHTANHVHTGRNIYSMHIYVHIM